MSFMFSINYFIFSIFLTLFGLEVGIAVTMLLEYDRYKDKLKVFLMPLWEITGTFAVFYLVNLEATVPSLLLLLGTIYVIPLLVAAVFFILRNAFLSYSEYMKNENSEKLYLHIYILSTVIIAFIAISVLNSAISGISVNASSYSINLAKMFINSFNILMFIGIALLAVFVASVVFKVHEYRWFTGVAAILGVVSIAIAMHAALPYMFSNAFGFGLLYLIGILIILAATIALHYYKNKYAGYLAVIWFILAINFFGFIQGNYLLGGTANLNNYIATGSAAFYVNMVTLIGGTILAVSLAFFIYISYIKKAPAITNG